MNFTKILTIIQTAAEAGPAFFELAEQVIAAFAEDDQATLKYALAAARARSDALHRDVQDSLADAAKR